jgi:choline-sulfatase
MAGAPEMKHVNGISQYPNMLDKSKKVRERCLIEYRNGYGEQDCSSKVLVTDKYKYARYQTGIEELTDLSKDPEERLNVAEDPAYKEIKDQMRIELLDEILSTEPRGPEQNSHS